ncbi:hypothetical protein ACHQM5_004982 [Ranunculus cassubicifolius]
MSTFTNPENAPKRAEELEKVDQKAATLHDLITSKRYRGSWQKILERIMFKYVELCYRYVCQSVNVGSLEVVIKHFLQLSSERAENAKSKAQALEDAALDVDDLEADKRPEALYSFLQEIQTTEFRRLCEIIRNHLTNLNKFKDQRDMAEISAPETLQLYLDTRFEQLKVATELALWQEAFRTVEDIHGLMCAL